MSTYLFDQAWRQEHDRLHALEAQFDDASAHHLARLGAGPGCPRRCSTQGPRPLSRGGDQDFFNLCIRQVYSQLLRVGPATQADADRFLQLTTKPSLAYVLMVMVTHGASALRTPSKWRDVRFIGMPGRGWQAAA